MTNKELFASMQGQLKPSPQARAALEARLAQPVKKRPAPWKYGAVAACAALVLAAWPIYRVLSPALHAVVPGQGGYTAYQETEDTLDESDAALPHLNIWDTVPPSSGSSASYTSGEGVNREVTQDDLDALLGGSVPDALGWEGFSDLTGYLAFGPGHGAPLDDLFYGHFYGSCTWGEFTLMVGGQGVTVSPDAVGRPEDWPGDGITVLNGGEIRAARFAAPGGEQYGEMSVTLDSGYSIFYSVTAQSAREVEELLARMAQAAVVDGSLHPEALADDPAEYSSGDAPADAGGDAAAPAPLAGVDSWKDQPWFGGYYYDNEAGRYVIVQVEGTQLPNLDFGSAALVTGKYSYSHLSGLMDQLDALAMTDPECGGVMATWALNEMDNRIDLTITEENAHLLAILAKLDPDGDAIRVELGAVVSTDSQARADDAVSYQTAPGGIAPTEEPIAIEPAADNGSARPDQGGLAEQPVSDGPAPSFGEGAPGEIPAEGSTSSCSPNA